MIRILNGQIPLAPSSNLLLPVKNINKISNRLLGFIIFIHPSTVSTASIHLSSMASFIPVAVEPSEKTKSLYRDRQAKSEQHWKDVQAQKQQARQVLSSNSNKDVEPFPLEIQVKGETVAAVTTNKSTTTTQDRPSVDQESLLEELQSMIYRTYKNVLFW